jgi:hypothetical protein
MPGMEPGSFWLLLAIALVSFSLAFIGAAVGLVLGHLRLPLLITYLGSPGAGAMTNRPTQQGGGATACGRDCCGDGSHPHRPGGHVGRPQATEGGPAAAGRGA